MQDKNIKKSRKMKKNTETAERIGMDELFLDEQKQKILRIIAKKEEDFNIIKDEKDVENKNLAKKTRTEIEELNKALVRIENKTYGICKGCQENIPNNRLRALPATDKCTYCASKN